MKLLICKGITYANIREVKTKNGRYAIELIVPIIKK